jgi:hypothetical protein
MGDRERVMLSATTSTSASDAYQSVPPTAESSAAHLSDACALLALMVRSQSASQDSTKTQVQVDFKRMQELKQQLTEAIQAAKDAADHSGFFGFLSNVFGSDIAQIAGAVAAIAAVVATGGAAAPLVLMAVSVALEEGAKIGAKLGLDPKICMALSVCSAAVGLCSGVGSTQAASTLANTAHDVGLAANIVKGAASATGSTLGFVSAHYQAKQLGDQADAVGYQAQDDTTSMDLDDAIALLQQSLHTEQSETTTTSAIIQNNANTNSSLSDRI